MVQSRRNGITNEKMKRADFVLTQFKRATISQLLINRRMNGSRRRLIDILTSNVFKMTQMNRANQRKETNTKNQDILNSLLERLGRALQSKLFNRIDQIGKEQSYRKFITINNIG